MGLKETLRGGGVLDRQTIVFTGDGSGIGSASLGLSYTILSIETNASCRLRLYDLQASRDNATEASRAFGNTNIPASIALIGDFSMSAAGIYSITPALYGVVNDTTNGYTHYRLEGSPTATIQVTRYLLEDPLASVSVPNRRNIPIISASLNVNAASSGTMAAGTVPQTFLLVSASLGTSTHKTRLRLYFTPESLSNTTEKNRVFSSEPSSSAKLLVDAIISGSETTYFVPKIVGANLQNMGTNLTAIANNDSLMTGRNEVYYLMENIGPATAAISASIHIYSLED